MKAAKKEALLKVDVVSADKVEKTEILSDEIEEFDTRNLASEDELLDLFYGEEISGVTEEEKDEILSTLNQNNDGQSNSIPIGQENTDGQNQKRDRSGDRSGDERGSESGIESGRGTEGQEGTEVSSAERQPTEIGNNSWGKVFQWAKGKVVEAANFLKNAKSGYLKGVFYRSGLGEIDLFWGNDKGGLAHIIAKHVIEHSDFASVNEAVSVIDDVISTGEIIQQSNGRIALVKDGKRVVTEKTIDGNWVVTAFDETRKQKEKKRSEEDVTRLHQDIFGKEDGELVSPNSTSAYKDTKGSADESGTNENIPNQSPSQPQSILERAKEAAADYNVQREIKAAEAVTDTNPSDAQKEAGNYRKGKVSIDGYTISIENPKGSERSGTDNNGKKWTSKMNNTYGFIRGTEGNDKDHLDVFLGDNAATGNVYVVDQSNEDGSFNEHKVMLGFNTAEEAEKAYYANYESNWKERHPANKITAVNLEDFEKWVNSSKRKTKAFAEYASVKQAQKEEATQPTAEATQAQKVDIAESLDKYLSGMDSFGSQESIALMKVLGEMDKNYPKEVEEFMAENGIINLLDFGKWCQKRHEELHKEQNSDRDGSQLSVDKSDKAKLTQAEQEAFNSVSTMIGDKGIEVIAASDEMTEEAMKQKSLSDELVRQYSNTISSHLTDAAKLQEIIDNLSALSKNVENQTSTYGVITDFANAIGANGKGASKYAEINLPSGNAVSIRISNHNANANNYETYIEYNGNVSIVFKSKRSKNRFISNDKVELTEYVYTNEAIAEDGSILSSIAESLSDMIKTGNYVDKSGKAIVNESPSAVQAMIGYHGSPHSFDAFDHTHMGEGEGAQVHGWGTYVTRSKGIARKYALMDSPFNPATYKGSVEVPAGVRLSSLEKLMGDGRTLSELADFITSSIRRAKKSGKMQDAEIMQRELDFIQNTKEEDWVIGGEKNRQLYTVNIPDDNGRNYLDERNPLTKEQQEHIIAQAEKEDWGEVEFYEEKMSVQEYFEKHGKDIQGEDIQKALGKLHTDKEVSEFLNRAGFVGIKYDGRTDGECYVIFNDKDAKITEHIQFFKSHDGKTIYGWAKDGKIYLTKAGMNPNTPLHEFTHLYDDVLMRKNPKLWAKGKELMKQTPVWNEVLNDPSYADIKDDEDKVASEAHSRLVGKGGADILAKMAEEAKSENDLFAEAEKTALVDRLKSWLKDAYRWLMGKDAFDSKQWSEADLKRMTLDDFNAITLGELTKARKMDTSTQTEEETIIEKAKADGTYKKAPNGKPTRLNETQWTQVRTKDFKEWFGDWENDLESASKVVDENGEPMVVSHSTNKTFTEFRNKQENDAGWLGEGYYFFGDRSLDGQYGSNVIEAFLDIKEPYYATNEEHERLSGLNDNEASSYFPGLCRMKIMTACILMEI